MEEWKHTILDSIAESHSKKVVQAQTTIKSLSDVITSD